MPGRRSGSHVMVSKEFTEQVPLGKDQKKMGVQCADIEGWGISGKKNKRLTCLEYHLNLRSKDLNHFSIFICQEHSFLANKSFLFIYNVKSKS